jgi:monoamine oxidase
MKTVDVAIVGGGLSGVYLAYRLQQQGITYCVVEAKPELGGRIFSPSLDGRRQGVDLGPTWFWPHQHNMLQLLDELGVPWFEQYTQGDVLCQMHAGVPVQRSAGAGAMTSYRVDGGMMRLVNALVATLDSQAIYTSFPVSSMVKQSDGDWLLSGSGDDGSTSIKAARVVLAAPPRVLLQHMDIALHLPEALSQQLLMIPTWMAVQAKFVAVYSQPFWREEGLSGDVFSRVGPMIELHDASADTDSTDGSDPADGAASTYALFGFVGVPFDVREQYTSDVFKQRCLSQLIDVFGESAAKPLQYYVKDWAQDPWVATAQDKAEVPNHPHIAMNTYRNQLDALSLSFVGAEYAQSEAGYLEGALISAQSEAESIVERLQKA